MTKTEAITLLNKVGYAAYGGKNRGPMCDYQSYPDNETTEYKEVTLAEFVRLILEMHYEEPSGICGGHDYPLNEDGEEDFKEGYDDFTVTEVVEGLSGYLDYDLGVQGFAHGSTLDGKLVTHMPTVPTVWGGFTDYPVQHSVWFIHTIDMTLREAVVAYLGRSE